MKEYRNLWNFDRNSPKLIENLKALGISIPFTEEILKSAYREKIKAVHSDHGGSDEECIKVQEAYRFLQSYVSEEMTVADIDKIIWARIKIEELEPLKNFADCTSCNGKGKWIDSMQMPIYAQYGMKCWKCNGTGDYIIKCRQCVGTGKFTLKSGRIVECRNCYGIGTCVVGKCRNCNGSGYWRSFNTPIIEYKTIKIKQSCSGCRGTGRIEIYNPVIKSGCLHK